MNKKIAAAWLICFGLLLILPQIIWAMAGQHFTTSATENITVTQAPKLTKENYREFPGEFENYFNNHVPFRSQLITLSSLADVNLFREKNINDKVVIGKNNWLFLSAQQNMEDYKGTNLFTREQLETVVNNLLTSKDYLDKRGIEFVLFIAPNKEAIYGEENLPGYYKAGAITRAEQLTEYLQENTDIRVVYPREELQAYKDDYFLYWHYDTHWNSAGGYIGSRVLLKELGIEMPPIEELTCVSHEYSGYDLARMMNLQPYYEKYKPADKDYYVMGYNTNNLQVIEQNDSQALIYHSDAPDERKLFMARDSFGGAMAWVLAGNFRDSYMPHWIQFFQQSQIEEQQPDIFVLEIVERDVGALQNFCLSE